MIVADFIGAKENCSTVQGTRDNAYSEFIEAAKPYQEKSITPIHGGGEGTHQTSQYSSLTDFGTFTQHLMCKNCYANYTPIEPTTIFSPSDTKAACLTTVTLRIDDTVDFRWYYRNDSSKTWVFCYNWSYHALYYDGEHAIEGYLNIRGYWPGIYYPRAYKLEVYYMNSSLLFREFFEVTNGGLNSPRMCKDVDVNRNPINMTSRFTIGVDTKAYHYLRFDKVAYFNNDTGFCHNFTTVWIQPDGNTYKIHSGSFKDYKDENATLNYWEYVYGGEDYISIDSGTPTGNWKVEVYLDSYYFNNTWMPYGPIATTPFIVGNGTVADWTFMVYLDADNTLETAGIEIFLKMASVGSSSQVNVIVQMDRIDGQDDRYGNWTDCKRFNITKGMTPAPENAVQNLTEVNMGDPNTLRDFVNWTINNYTANYYFLVIWDHGAGFIGCCLDVTNASDILTLPELSQALSGFPVIMDVVFIDACTMAMPEVAYQIKDYTNVLVGPEGLGYAMVDTSAAPYNEYLSSLTSNSTMSPSAFAKNVINNYIGWCLSTSIPNATMSATDLTKMTSLTAAIDDFAINLKEKETPYHEEISRARNLTQVYEGPFQGYTGYYIDLYHFAQLTYQNVPDIELRNAANQVMIALSIGNAIIVEADKADPNAHGLSIFFPDQKGKYESFKDLYEKTAFTIDTPWDELLKYHLSGYILTIQTPYSDIEIMVNETSYTTDAYKKIRVFVLPGFYSVNVTAIVLTGPDLRRVFTQWNDGNTTNPRTFFVNRELTLEAEYETQYRLIMSTNFGTTSPSVGEHWKKENSTVNIQAFAPSLVYPQEQERYVCGWIGIGSGGYNGSDNPASIIMWGAINETVTWKHEYYLTINCPHGSSTPSSKWCEAGTFLNGSVTSPVSGLDGIRYVCIGWTGTGSAPVSGNSTMVNFTIDEPSTINWNWKTQYLLTVRTDPAGLSPQPNVFPQGPWYDNDTLVSLTAQEISAYVFDHWTADGLSWDHGVNPITNFTVNGPYEAIAHYERARAWWEILTRPENLQIILGLVGIVVTVALGVTAWVRTRKKRSILRAFLNEIDEVYSKYKADPRKCEEELYRLRNTVLEGLTDGKITEENYNIIDSRIDKYMTKLQEQKKT
jgi:hypothetical protein